MLIGAYRDNEVDCGPSANAKARRDQGRRRKGRGDHAVAARPKSTLGSWLRMLFAASRSSAAPLAKLVHEKTGGNPFFAIQFLSSLVEEELLTFDHDGARWSWDLDRIHAKGYTDNVVDLMVGKAHPPAD